jgi:hypothetical protein
LCAAGCAHACTVTGFMWRDWSDQIIEKRSAQLCLKKVQEATTPLNQEDLNSFGKDAKYYTLTRKAIFMRH